MRIAHRRNAIQADTDAREEAKCQGEAYTPIVLTNGDTHKQLLARSRYLLFKSKDRLIWKHTDDVFDASDVAQGLYSSQGNVSDLVATEGTDAPQTSMSNNEVYNRHTTAKQPVEAAETSQDAEQGDTQTSSSMNAPTSSEGKDVNNQSDLQENTEKSSKKEIVTPLSEQISTVPADVNTNPIEAQKKAGNYKKDHELETAV